MEGFLCEVGFFLVGGWSWFL